MAWTKKKAISLAAQAGHLEKLYPSSHGSIKRSALTWIVKLRPSSLSQDYMVQLRYKIGMRPDIVMLEPKIQKRDGELPSHLFPNERLCLYLPEMGEWNCDMLLADTIIPWISEWLFHYEIWLATGEWCGGGEHPGTSRKAISDDGHEGYPLETDRTSPIHEELRSRSARKNRRRGKQ